MAVSLGSYCAPALTLRERGIRPAALPFDWILSVDGDKLLEILEDDFRFFMDDRYLRPHPTSGVLLHHRYHLEFSHEVNSHGAEYFADLDGLRARYERRVARFRQLADYRGPVDFIRRSWSLSTHPNYVFRDEGNLMIGAVYASRLLQTLSTRFPKLDLRLIIVNSEANTEDDAMISDRLRILSATSFTDYLRDTFQHSA